MPRKQYAGAAPETELASSIGSSDTSFEVTDAAGYPDGSVGPFVVALSHGASTEEKVLCASRTNDTFTVDTRGYDDTTAQTHTSGSAVAHVLDAETLDEANEHANDDQTGVAHEGVNLGSSGVADGKSARADGSGGVIFEDVPHAETTGKTTDDHHAEVHDHTANTAVPAGGLDSGTATDGQSARADGAGGVVYEDVPHSETTGQTTDDHHAQSHAHDGVDGSGTVAHSDTTGQTAGDHHPDRHPAGVAADDHHNEDHGARHHHDGADTVNAEDLGTAAGAGIKMLQPANDGQVHVVDQYELLLSDPNNRSDVPTSEGSFTVHTTVILGTVDFLNGDAKVWVNVPAGITKGPAVGKVDVTYRVRISGDGGTTWHKTRETDVHISADQEVIHAPLTAFEYLSSSELTGDIHVELASKRNDGQSGTVNVNMGPSKIHASPWT